MLVMDTLLFYVSLFYIHTLMPFQTLGTLSLSGTVSQNKLFILFLKIFLTLSSLSCLWSRHFVTAVTATEMYWIQLGYRSEKSPACCQCLLSSRGSLKANWTLTVRSTWRKVMWQVESKSMTFLGKWNFLLYNSLILGN